jgi:hypothetical protein
MGLSFKIAAGPRQRSHSQVRVPQDSWPHFTLSDSIQDSPNLEGQAHVFISPRNRVARLYPQAPGSLFITSYDSQGYGESIWPRLHTGFHSVFSARPLYRLPVTMGNVCCLFDIMEASFANRWLAVDSRISSLLWERVFREPTAGNGLPCGLHYSGFQASCHNIQLA